MNNLSILFILLFLHQIALNVFCYNATDSILLNCGSNQSYVARDGRNWTADLLSKYGPFDESNYKSLAFHALNQDNSTFSAPYLTARVSKSQFSYNFTVTSGQKFVRLHFRPTDYNLTGFQKYEDWFDVRVGPYTFLRNFSASHFATDRVGETFVKEFCVNVAEEQSLKVTFAPFFSDSNDSYVFINGIEVVSMPSNLYYTAPDDVQGIKFVGQDSALGIESFRVQNHTALGTVCRLNVGGSSIRPENDTGIYRLWTDDYFYQVSVGNPSRKEGDAHLTYSKIEHYVAPDDVYLSSRIRSTDDLTWGVSVNPGYMYLVRLHFCEYFSRVKVNQSRFDIFIDNKTAEIGLDIVEAAGGSFIPIYKDYLVIAGKKEETQNYMLEVSIRPDGFLNGMEVIRLNDSDGSLAGPNLLNLQTPYSDESNSKWLIIAGGGSVIVFLLILVLLWGLKKGKKKHGSYSRLFSYCGRLSCRKDRSTRSKASWLPRELCCNFSIDEIKDATNNFNKSLIIGEGGFGKVYKGKINNGTTLMVAIKRLNQDSKQGIHEFKTEIVTLSQLRHVHLVSLLGYCTDEGEMILVYDYMINGTLREHLYDTGNDPLTWKQRLDICIGAARGLDYLHTGVAHTIIHRDIKSTNILLDENWIAKVSDFGLSRISENDTVSTMVKGTFGYLDPEYAQGNKLTTKSDVYSFGVVLFEVLCARKPVKKKVEEPMQMSLTLWARKCIQNGIIHLIIDPYLIGKISPDCFNQFVDIAERCIRDHGADRPSMNDVKKRLEFALELQEAADAKNKGFDHVYPHVAFSAPFYTNLVVESEFNGFEISSTDTSYDREATSSLCFESDTVFSNVSKCTAT